MFFGSESRICCQSWIAMSGRPRASSARAFAIRIWRVLSGLALGARRLSAQTPCCRESWHTHYCNHRERPDIPSRNVITVSTPSSVRRAGRNGICRQKTGRKQDKVLIVIRWVFPVQPAGGISCALMRTRCCAAAFPRFGMRAQIRQHRCRKSHGAILRPMVFPLRSPFREARHDWQGTRAMPETAP